MLNGSHIAERHAFVVDDEPLFRAFVGRMLKSSGFVGHEFEGLRDVEAALTLRRPEIIILDLSLRGADGIEIMRSLAVARFGGHVLLVSGHSAGTLEDVRRIGERLGLRMAPPLSKPFRLGDFKQRLAEVGSTADETAGGEFGAMLRNNHLELWYQPKINLTTMAVVGAEALIRCRDPERGILAPGLFLPPPGDPLYKPLTDFVVRRSLADWSSLAALPALTGRWTGARMAINVPASILQSADFVADVRRHLPHHPEFSGLIVEITEDEAIRDPERAREVAVQLQLYGIHVSIDDFGAGHASLGRLDELPFAELKLDRAFVDGCAHDAGKRAMCRSVVELAHRFGMTAVAEGLETPDDLRILIELGFDVGQGYLFARPMPVADFVRYLEVTQAAGRG